MLTAYLDAAMRRAEYEILPDGEGYYGHVPALDGVWAQSASLEGCRAELREVLEEWVLLGLRKGTRVPALDGIDLCTETLVS